MSLFSIKIFNVPPNLIFKLLNILFFTICLHLLLSFPCFSLPFVVFVGRKRYRISWVRRIMRIYIHWWHFIQVLLRSFGRILWILLYWWCWVSELLVWRIRSRALGPLKLLVISHWIRRHVHHTTVVVLLIWMHIWHRIWIRWIHWWILTQRNVHWWGRIHIGRVIRRMLIIVIFIA